MRERRSSRLLPDEFVQARHRGLAIDRGGVLVRRTVTRSLALGESLGGTANPARSVAVPRFDVQSPSCSRRRRRGASFVELVRRPHVKASVSSRYDAKLGGITNNSSPDEPVGSLCARAWRNGKRAGFRCRCSRELEGSSPSVRTDFVALFAQVRGSFHAPATPTGQTLGTLQIKNGSDGIEIGVEQVGIGVERDLR
jgi:hypothetical protein